MSGPSKKGDAMVAPLPPSWSKKTTIFVLAFQKNWMCPPGV